jgi:hypothetical protein
MRVVRRADNRGLEIAVMNRLKARVEPMTPVLQSSRGCTKQKDRDKVDVNNEALSVLASALDSTFAG